MCKKLFLILDPSFDDVELLDLKLSDTLKNMEKTDVYVQEGHPLLDDVLDVCKRNDSKLYKASYSKVESIHNTPYNAYSNIWDVVDSGIMFWSGNKNSTKYNIEIAKDKSKELDIVFYNNID